MAEIDALDDDIVKTATTILRRRHASNLTPYCNRRFRSLFGVDPNIVTLLWVEKQHNLEETVVAYLLWALMFLKLYATETVHAALAGVDEKTFRKWAWSWIEHLAHLKTIVWHNRFARANEGASMFVSLDGTDFRIHEPKPFDRMWYSHKFHGPELRYEIGLCIRTGQIVWINGGVPCGSWPDLTLGRSAFVPALALNESVLADLVYSGEACFVTPNTQMQTSRRQKAIMSRHETVNARLKQFGALRQIFRHELHLHPLCVYAAANIVQVTIENGSPLFSIN